MVQQQFGSALPLLGSVALVWFSDSMSTSIGPRLRPIAVGLVALALAIAGTGTVAMAADETRQITVTATGSVDAAPDMATFSTGILTFAVTAKGALDENSRSMRNLIDGLKALGIASEDLQTSSFNISPRYARQKSGAARIDGFEVRNTLTVLIRDPSELGRVLDSAASLGANEFGGLSFIVSKADALLDDARADAIGDARRKAKIYAQAAGAKLGKVVRIDEQGRGGAPRPMMRGRVMAAEAVPIESGQSTISATVTVVWELE